METKFELITSGKEKYIKNCGEVDAYFKGKKIPAGKIISVKTLKIM